jgi:hypothetical protein
MAAIMLNAAAMACRLFLQVVMLSVLQWFTLGMSKYNQLVILFHQIQYRPESIGQH